ncbi:MAG TPA: tRNA (guanosine(46)-N7)-methyltransferase TrmB [Roseiarcus sp.]|nr:tRNA (guanosine(46)-N7)-methyltransferase TrmB [Roseiarcus sp.]
MHGKALRSHQAWLIRTRLPQLELPRSAAIDCAALFPFTPSEIWLEIGFGGGEHLTAQAMARRDVGFIGAEPFVNGLAKALAAIERDGLANIRLRAGDALELIQQIPAAALSRVFILYPDPWPKRRHHKRRIVSSTMVSELARVLRPGGEARFATDIDDYAGWTLRRFLDSEAFSWAPRKANDWREPWPEWRETRYEAKAKREGRRPVYLTFFRE